MMTKLVIRQQEVWGTTIKQFCDYDDGNDNEYDNNNDSKDNDN